MRTRRFSAVAATLLTAVLAAGCGGSGSDAPESAPSSAPAAEGPVKLTYWTWVPNMDKIVAVWNNANPDIQVTVSKQAGGDDASAKFLTAAKAGNPPDLVQAEYQHLPSFVAADAVADLSQLVGDAKGEFSEGLWNLVTLGTDAVYGIPQDSGPMMLYYRADLFKKYGIEVPKTWDEYAEAARPQGLSRHVLQQGPRIVRRARPAGGRAVVVDQRGVVEGRRERRRHPEGRRLLGRPGQGGRHR
jgi:multiple sugar transport system substrate-binding protein